MSYPKSYSQAVSLLRGRDSRKIANNTMLAKRGENIAVRYHETDVVTFRPDGFAVLNSGGWQTSTTKLRLNECGFNISQERGVWYLRDSGKSYTFADGMIVGPDSVSGAGPDAREALRERRAVSRYCAKFIAALKSGEVEAPGPGDCFYCGMVTTEGKTLGESFADREHIREHIRESYFVPSRAFRLLLVVCSQATIQFTIENLRQFAQFVYRCEYLLTRPIQSL